MRILAFIWGYLFSAFGFSQQPLLKISKLTENVFVYTTFHDFKGSLVPANGLYLVTQEGVFLIDTPWDTTQLQPLLDSIEAKHETRVVGCLSTHFHEDRTGGLTYLRKKGVSTYTTHMTDQLSKDRGKPRAQFLITHDTAFKIGKQFVQTFYPGKGHSPDNIVVWLPQEKVLFGGCFAKSTEASDLGNLSDASVESWSSSIERVMRQFPNPSFVIPGHQGWTQNNGLQHTMKLIESFRSQRAHEPR